jgi:hypothetical protein
MSSLTTGVVGPLPSIRLRKTASYVTGLPGRYKSRSPLRPHTAKRLRHLVTVGMETLNSRATCWISLPSRQARMILGTLHGARLLNPALRDGNQTRLVFG